MHQLNVSLNLGNALPTLDPQKTVLPLVRWNAQQLPSPSRPHTDYAWALSHTGKARTFASGDIVSRSPMGELLSTVDLSRHLGKVY